MTADDLVCVHEPFRWNVQLGERGDPENVAATVRRGMVGAWTDSPPPGFLYPHQLGAYARALAAVRVYGGALLCDSVGLGKTYIALAIAREFTAVTVAAPAAIVPQWRNAASQTRVAAKFISHEALSRGRIQPSEFELIVVDEAHRFRNPKTIRYRTLSGIIGRADVLLITATPVVNHPVDLLHVVRLFLPDHGMALHGIPSLEALLKAGTHKPILKCLSPLLTARTPEVMGSTGPSIPKVTDAPVLAAAPLCRDALVDVLAGIDALEFPSFSNREASRLLRSHLLYRLHSSVFALEGTLRRHRSYLQRAIDAARCGSALTRADVRRVFDRDDSQIEIAPLLHDHISDHVDETQLQAELRRIVSLAEFLRGERQNVNPKLNHLISYLDSRQGHKTIVFVNAVPTALEIARRLKWHKLMMVTSGTARIASGNLPLTEALQLFAPKAHQIPLPPERLAAYVLVTTDILSEGVNLQDADAVVHYDLPWTSLRLQQRVGRISRIGTPFDNVSVRWFIPSPPIEQRLGLCRRIAQKLQYQMQLGVPVTSEVGRARITNETLRRREQIIHRSDFTLQRAEPHFAVVQAPLLAAYAVRWHLTSGVTRDVIVTTANGVLTDLGEVCDSLELLFAAPESSKAPDGMLMSLCEESLRRRLAATSMGPINLRTRHLARRIIESAREATKRRRFDELEVLDGVLQTLQTGVCAGAESELEDLIDVKSRGPLLHGWVCSNRRRYPHVLDVRVEAALFGDGSHERAPRPPGEGRHQADPNPVSPPGTHPP